MLDVESGLGGADKGGEGKSERNERNCNAKLPKA